MSTPLVESPVRGGYGRGGFGGFGPSGSGEPLRTVEVLGLDYVKFLEQIRTERPDFFPTLQAPPPPPPSEDSTNSEKDSPVKQHPTMIPDEVAGIHPGFLPYCTKVADRIVAERASKKLCVVFDGLMLPMTVSEKVFSEDLVMATAWHLVSLQHEVVFAPFLAQAQLEVLSSNMHIQGQWHPQPPTIPTGLLEWNSRKIMAPNIHKYTPTMTIGRAAFAPGQAMCVSSNDFLSSGGQSQSEITGKVIERWASLDAHGTAPVLFLLQFGGVISPKLARALALRLVENDSNSTPTTDRDAEKALYKFMSVLLPLRAQIVHQLVSEVTPQSVYLHWDDNSAHTTPPLIGLDSWRIGQLVNGTNGPNGRNHSNYLEPWGLTHVLRYESCATQERVAVDVFSLVPTVILRALDLMGYFTHAQEDQDNTNNPNAEHSSCSIYGAALKTFEPVPELGEAAFLFIELVRTNAFNILKQEDKTAAAAAAAGAEDNNGNTDGGDNKKKPDQTDGKRKGEGLISTVSGDDLENADGGSSEITLNVPEDVGVKIACLVPINTMLDLSKFSRDAASAAAAEKKNDASAEGAAAAAAASSSSAETTASFGADHSAAHEILAAQSQFIKAAQAHVRSLRMLMEASAGNVILRDFQNPAYVRSSSPNSISANAGLLSTLAGALPFKTPPSSRAIFFFAAAKQCRGDVDALCARFGITGEEAVATARADMERMKKFAHHCALAREHLAVEDEDVGLDADVIKRVEPAVIFFCESIGVQVPPPQLPRQDSQLQDQ